MSLRLRIKNIFEKEEGQSLVEILVGLSIGALIIGSATIAIVVLLRSGSSSERFQQIALIAQDTIEKVHSISDSSWANLNDLDKGSANNYFFMASSTETLIIKGKEGVVSGGINSGLIAHWKMDEEEGSVIYDHSFNSNVGDLQNSPTRATSTDCKVGGCLEFSGESLDNQHVGFSDDSFWPTGGSHNYSDPLTVSLWVKADTTSQESSLIGRFDSSGSSHWDNYGSGIKYVNGEVRAMARHGGDNDLLTYPLTDTEGWHHVVAIIHTTEGELYVDGVRRDSGILDSGYVYALGIGAQINANVTFEFDGSLDDIRIYNRALSSDEVWNLYNSNVYQSYFYVEDVCRTDNVSYEIDGVTPCGVGSVRDPNTLKVTVVIEWNLLGETDQFELSDYVTRWRNRTYTQTDWSGSSGEDGPYTNPTSNFSTSSNIDFSGGTIKVELDE